MTALTATATIEQTVAAVVERLLARYRLLMEQMGDRPLGYERGNKWEVLEAYLDQLRGNPVAWQQMVAWQQQRFNGNIQAAVIETIKEATKLERSLALEGGWDRTPEDYARACMAGEQRVRAEMFARRIGPAERAMREVEKQAALPAPLIGPELAPLQPPYGALVPEGPLAQPAPAGMLPLPQAGPSPIQNLAPPPGVML
jgi:hypothetical protein